MLTREEALEQARKLLYGRAQIVGAIADALLAAQTRTAEMLAPYLHHDVGDGGKCDYFVRDGKYAWECGCGLDTLLREFGLAPERGGKQSA